MLEKTLTDIESPTKDRKLSVESVISILEMANTPYDSESRDSNIQLIKAQKRLKAIISGSDEVLTKYLLILENKGFIRYHKEQRLYAPTDKGIHFLQIYNMLSDLLRQQ